MKEHRQRSRLGCMSSIAFERRGSGPPLVLIHGIGSWWRMWSPVLDRLAEHHEVAAIDVPGFGDSPPLPAGTPPRVENLVRAVAAFLDEQGWERAHLAGNSM